MKKMKWAILGTGWISHCFAESFAAAEQSELVAVCSRKLETAQAFAKEFHIPEAYAGMDELFANSEAEIVYIGSPNMAHLDNVLQCLEAGKHVLCEKPMATNERETREMVAAARKHGLFLMEAMWTRFFPAMRKAKQWLDEGRIGKPLMLNASFAIDNSNENQWRWDINACGGSLVDLGIYGLAFANDMMGGAPAEHRSFFEVKNGVDIANSILLKHGKNQFSQISSSLYLKTSHHAGIFGEKGSIYIGAEFWRPDCAKLYAHNGDMFQNDLVETFEAPYAATGYQFEADAVSQYVAQGMTESPIMPLDESIALAKLMEELRKEHGVIYPTDK